MADQLYLSLWYPNFRLASLPAALSAVLHQFVRIAAEGKPNSPYARVSAASAYPINWNESPTYQRIYVNDDRSETGSETTIEAAVAEATEQLHDDTAYEFEMRWGLWTAEDTGELVADAVRFDTAWRLEPTRVRIIGFGPDFDNGAFEQNGHIRVDFGLDTPWTFENQTFENQTFENQSDEGEEIDADTAKHIQQNVEKLLAFTLSIEKHCGISSRLLWTESGEPLAEKLVARLQRLN